MKKFIFLIGLLLLLPNVIFATSGACSNHGHVNCSLSNGLSTVICNDGFRDSSTSYFDLDECKGVRCDPNAVSAYSISQGMAGSSFGSSSVNNCNNFNATLDNQAVITPSIPSINTSGLAQILADRSMDNWCKTHIGGQSYWDHPTMNCGCNAGFLMVNNLCVNAGQVAYNQQQKQEADKRFDDAFNQALNISPQYKDIADKEVVKSSAIKDASDPVKKDLTILDILKELYPQVQPISQPIVLPNIQATTTPTTAPVISMQPIVKSMQPRPKPTQIVSQSTQPNPIKNVKEPAVTAIATHPQPIKSNSIFSKFWNFIKNIF